jgi:ubiquinone/menaquinone biosynthesis C-methylase UbiE
MREAQESKLKEILKKVSLQGRVLDVGCGPGFLSYLIPHVCSVDVDLQSLKEAKGLKVLADGNRLPFKDESFSTVFCIDTIHLLQSPDEIFRVLKVGGEAVISTYCNKYNKDEKLQSLISMLKDFTIKREFIVGNSELDAVVVASKSIKKKLK